MIYIDSSALTKLVVPEYETESLRRYFRTTESGQAATSELTVVELRRAALRRGVEALADVIEQTLSRVDTASLTQGTLQRAAALRPPALRTLDALHVATALELRITTVVTYDQRMAQACRANGLKAVSPGVRGQP